MEDNYNIDEQINKIKAQMQGDIHDPDNSIFKTPDELMSGEDEIPQELMSEVAPKEQNQEPEAWKDPFGHIAENDAVKKFVVYISKDYTPFIEDLDTDARSAFINDAIDIKLNIDKKNAKWFAFERIVKHVLLSIFVFCLAVPALLWFADKSITVTKDNYSYVQKNFEKLYKEKASRDRAIRAYRMQNQSKH